MHDRAVFNDSGPHRDLALLFSPGQNVTGDRRFTGKRTHVIFPFKSRKETNWRHGRKWNKRIRKQRMVNEWSIGLVRNSFCLFIGNCSFEEGLFAPIFHVAAMLVKIRISRRGVIPMTTKK